MEDEARVKRITEGGIEGEAELEQRESSEDNVRKEGQGRGRKVQNLNLEEEEEGCRERPFRSFLPCTAVANMEGKRIRNTANYQ